jgi:vacuolar iron transporter family protein
MAISLTKATRKVLLSFQDNEITEHHIYLRLSAIEKVPENKEILQQLAAEEKSHYEVFKSFTPEDRKCKWLKVTWYIWIARILGLTFALKLMERGEGDAQKNYSVLAATIPEIKKIMDDEDTHEQKLISMINEERLNYIGSIVLGLNDALVELTGALAGFSFAMQNTKIIAAAGLITGIAASFSMAASEYLSQKTEGAEHPLKSSVYTGIAYIFTVIMLILPYLVVPNYMLCLTITLLLAIFIIFAFNYYLSVATDVPFKKHFFEMAAISLGVAAISFGIGFGVKYLFGINL